MIDSLISTASSATDALEVKAVLDQLDDRLTDDVPSRVHEYIQNIYDGAASDLQHHGFCEEIAVVPVNERPQIIRTLPAQTLTMGSSSPLLDLRSYFRDFDSERITYMAISNDTSIATVETRYFGNNHFCSR